MFLTQYFTYEFTLYHFICWNYYTFCWKIRNKCFFFFEKLGFTNKYFKYINMRNYKQNISDSMKITRFTLNLTNLAPSSSTRNFLHLKLPFNSHLLKSWHLQFRNSGPRVKTKHLHCNPRHPVVGVKRPRQLVFSASMPPSPATPVAISEGLCTAEKQRPERTTDSETVKWCLTNEFF